MNYKIELPKDNKFVRYLLSAWYGGSAGYLEYQRAKKVAEAMADNDANKVRIAGEIEEKAIRDQMALIETLEQADRYIEYRNLYNVLTKAVPKIEYTGDEMRIDPDKLKRLKDVSKEFSSDEMQELIAWILAWEYNKPGSYCLQTMTVVKNMTREDIELFRKFCSLAIADLNWTFFFQNIFNGEKGDSGVRQIPKQVSEAWITLKGQLYLEELGILTSSNIALVVTSIDSHYNLKIGGKAITFDVPKPLTLSHMRYFTRAGSELLNLIDPTFNENLSELAKKELERQGFVLTKDWTSF